MPPRKNSPRKQKSPRKNSPRKQKSRPKKTTSGRPSRVLVNREKQRSGRSAKTRSLSRCQTFKGTREDMYGSSFLRSSFLRRLTRRPEPKVQGLPPQPKVQDLPPQPKVQDLPSQPKVQDLPPQATLIAQKVEIFDKILRNIPVIFRKYQYRFEDVYELKHEGEIIFEGVNLMPFKNGNTFSLYFGERFHLRITFKSNADLQRFLTSQGLENVEEKDERTFIFKNGFYREEKPFGTHPDILMHFYPYDSIKLKFGGTQMQFYNNKTNLGIHFDFKRNEDVQEYISKHNLREFIGET